MSSYSASAAPLLSGFEGVTVSSSVMEVQYRPGGKKPGNRSGFNRGPKRGPGFNRGPRGGGWGNRRRGPSGAAIGLGIAGAIIGGAIIANEAANAAPPPRAYDDGYGRCAATFRSFNPNTGTYVGFDGIERPCPYL
ncbi:BA14K family protein [Rhodomicrobium sp. Az07]|nr:BA14K family protein [Rhodomicrobium sp. Az07]